MLYRFWWPLFLLIASWFLASQSIASPIDAPKKELSGLLKKIGKTSIPTKTDEVCSYCDIPNATPFKHFNCNHDSFHLKCINKFKRLNPNLHITCPLCRKSELPVEERSITASQIDEAFNFIKKKDTVAFKRLIAGKFIPNEVSVRFIGEALSGPNNNFFNLIAEREELQVSNFSQLEVFADKLRKLKKYDALLLLIILSPSDSTLAYHMRCILLHDWRCSETYLKYYSITEDKDKFTMAAELLLQTALVNHAPHKLIEKFTALPTTLFSGSILSNMLKAISEHSNWNKLVVVLKSIKTREIHIDKDSLVITLKNVLQKGNVQILKKVLATGVFMKEIIRGVLESENASNKMYSAFKLKMKILESN